MAKITVTEKQENSGNLFYVQSTLAEVLSQTGCAPINKTLGSRAVLDLTVSDYYADIVRAEVIERLAEIVAINYKYKYFKKEIGVKGLSEEENEILLASLIAADLDDDKRYVYEKLKNFDEIPLDGVYNFRLQPLKRKWADIVSYMPPCFINEQLTDFITYLLEGKTKRAYIDDGRVYDGHYRRLKRVELLDGATVKIVREVLLSNCGEVEISGTIPEQDEHYLKKFFKDKIYFSKRYMG